MQLALHRANATRANGTQRCGSPNSCVMRTTGPDTYIHSIYRATKAANCTNPIQRVAPGECENTTDPYLARTYMCEDDPVEPGMPLMHCRAARHWDCRTGGRKCSEQHWQMSWRRTRPRDRGDGFAHYFNV